MPGAHGDQGVAVGALALWWRGGQKKVSAERNDQGGKEKKIKEKILIMKK